LKVVGIVEIEMIKGNCKFDARELGVRTAFRAKMLQENLRRETRGRGKHLRRGREKENERKEKNGPSQMHHLTIDKVKPNGCDQFPFCTQLDSCPATLGYQLRQSPLQKLKHAPPTLQLP